MTYKITFGVSPDDDNPLNEVIELPDIWRCGEHLYQSSVGGGNCKFVLDININHNKKIYMTLETAGTVQINIHPECQDFHQMCSMLNTIRGHGSWKYEYGKDNEKSLIFDPFLTADLADKLNQYRLTF